MGIKTFTVATAVQKAVLQEVLLGEIATGFWKNARPADHAESWKGVEIKVGQALGPAGFEVPRKYNFVNPDFFKKAGAKLLAAAQTVDPNMNEKQLKKALINLNLIVGERQKEIGGPVTKLQRGRARSTETTEVKQKPESKTTTRRVAANIVEEPAS